MKLIGFISIFFFLKMMNQLDANDFDDNLINKVGDFCFHNIYQNLKQRYPDYREMEGRNYQCEY